MNGIVFSVRADKLHERSLPTEVECGDQPVVSASNFEAGTIKGLSTNVTRTSKIPNRAELHGGTHNI